VGLKFHVWALPAQATTLSIPPSLFTGSIQLHYDTFNARALPGDVVACERKCTACSAKSYGHTNNLHQSTASMMEVEH
jgi:hypothetical protein